MGWRVDVYTKTIQNVHYNSSNGQDGPLPLPPLFLLLLQATCSVSKEHDVLFALDLPLEELQGCTVKTHHILKEGKWRENRCNNRLNAKKLCSVPLPSTQMSLTLISRTFESVLVRSSSMTDSSIWLLEI